MTETYLIPASNLSSLLAGIADLNKRCRKLGLAEITEAHHVDHVRLKAAKGEKETGWVQEVPDGYKDTGLRQEWYSVTVTGESPKVAGWSFVATLEPLPTDDGEVVNLVSNLPGEKCPVAYRTLIGHCDHCNVARRRKQTFVVRDERGGYKCVGRQCLKDFLGYNADPHTLASQAELLASLSALCVGAGEESFGGSGETGWSVASFLTQTSATIRVRGWFSKGAAYKLDAAERATANLVLNVLTPPWSGADQTAKDEWKALVVELTPTEADAEEAAKAIEWARGLEPKADEDYLANLNLIVRHGVVTRKTAGLSASIIAAYRRSVEDEVRKTELAKQPPSHFVGTVGTREKGPVLVTCTKLIKREGDYGVTGIHKLVDAAGNDLTWFASEGAEWIQEGESAHVSYTVKKHETFNGREQTVVSRVAVWTPEGVAAHEAKLAKRAAREAKKNRSAAVS